MTMLEAPPIVSSFPTKAAAMAVAEAVQEAFWPAGVHASVKTINCVGITSGHVVRLVEGGFGNGERTLTAEVVSLEAAMAEGAVLCRAWWGKHPTLRHLPPPAAARL